jgi:CheY-like chemotaxis protein
MPRVSDPQDSQQPVPAPGGASNGKTILLAEDDPFISRMYLTKLQAAGFTVITVANGRDAYEQIKDVKPDLILLDINMPELTGWEVIKALQAEGQEELTKRILVLTNSADPNSRKQAAELGVEFVVKAELTPHDVLTQINQRLSAK